MQAADPAQQQPPAPQAAMVMRPPPAAVPGEDVAAKLARLEAYEKASAMWAGGDPNKGFEALQAKAQEADRIAAQQKAEKEAREKEVQDKMAAAIQSPEVLAFMQANGYNTPEVTRGLESILNQPEALPIIGVFASTAGNFKKIDEMLKHNAAVLQQKDQTISQKDQEIAQLKQAVTQQATQVQPTERFAGKRTLDVLRQATTTTTQFPTYQQAAYAAQVPAYQQQQLVQAPAISANAADDDYIPGSKYIKTVGSDVSKLLFTKKDMERFYGN